MTRGMLRRDGHRGIGGLRPAVVLATLAIAVVAVGPAAAHEPLWGETPTIFGPGVFHPEIRIGYLRRGGSPAPGEESTRELAQEYALQYGINRFVNVRLMLPVTRMDIDGTRVSGAGDAVLDAKYRFHLRQDLGIQRSQALVFGWKAPTGDDERTAPGVSRLPPGDQPGSGRHGLELGWAADGERLVDSVWGSVFYHHDFGGGFRRGDRIEADAAYGRWVVRPNSAEDLGINLAFGLHAEALASDHLQDGSSMGNSHRFAGVHLTPIVTRGQTQFRVGVLVPLVRRGDEQETDFSYEVRAGWEMFF